MSQILIIENDQSLSTVLRLNLTKVLNQDILVKDGLQEAVEMLELLGDIRLIVAGENCGKEKIACRLQSYLESNQLNIPLIIYGQSEVQDKNYIRLESIQCWEKVVDSVCLNLGVSNKQEKSFSEEFVPVDINYFLNITATSMGCDVYIRIKKGQEYQYIKRLLSTDHFEREDIEKYKSTGLKEFYISKEHYSNFVNYVTTQLTLKLDSEEVEGMERIRLNSETYEITLDRIKNLGIDSFTVELVDESIKSMQVSIDENSALGSYLLPMLKNKMSYAYSRSYLTCLLLHKIIVRFSWNNPLFKEKINYLAYFHDILLKDEKLLRINSWEQLKEVKISVEENELVLEHAHRSAELLKQYKNIPYDVIDIIREHHGVKNGMGFSEELNKNISPLLMLFMVIEDFVIHYLDIPDEPGPEEIQKILNELSLRYLKGHYALALEALVGVLKSGKEVA